MALFNGAKSGFTSEDLARMGPDALTRKRLLADALLKQSSGIQDIRHPLQGFAQLANALVGGYKEAKLDRAEKAGKDSASAQWNELAASSGMGGAFPEAPGGQAAGGNVAQSLINSPSGAPSSNAGGNPAYRDAIASIESAGSGDYSAVGPTHPKMGRALGRYQIMEANIAPWAKEAIGREVSPDEFLANPKLQDAIFDKKFGGYVQQFGSPEAAAQAWFGGPGGVGKTGRQDSLGTTIGAYGDKFTNAMGGAGAAIDRAAPMQVASLDPSAGMGGPPPPPQQASAPPQQQVAQALMQGGDQQQPWTPAQPLPQGGPDMGMLMRAAGNEWNNPNQQNVIQALLGQKMKSAEPKKYGFQAGKDGSIFRTDPDSGSVEQVYGGKPAPGFRVLTPEEETKMGLDPAGAYQMGGDDNKISKIGGDGTTVNIGAGETAFDKAAGTKQAETMDTMASEGLNAKADLGVIGELEGMLAGQGGATTGISGWLAQRGIGGEGMDDLQATNALINKLVPSQRAPGSGSMSDRDVEMFRASLPSLWNTPGGNAKILGVMKGLAEYKRQQGEIASAVLSGDLDRNEARRKLQALPNPLANVGGPASPKTDEEFNALPSGAMFIDPDDGKTYKKP